MAKVKSFRGSVMIDGARIASETLPKVLDIAKAELRAFRQVFLKQLMLYWGEIHFPPPEKKHGK